MQALPGHVGDRPAHRAEHAVTPGDDLRVRLAEATAAHYLEPDSADADGLYQCVCELWGESEDGPGWDDHMAEVSALVFAALLRERVAAELAQPRTGVGRCRCERATLTSERSGRLTALGGLADEIDPAGGERREGLCGDRGDHEPHWHESTVGRFWCHADQTRRLPYAAEARR